MNRLFNKTKNMAVRTFGLCLMLIAAVSFSSCSSDNDPFFTATEDDAPRFLNSDLPKVNEKGELGSFGTILRTNNFKFGVIATPVDYTTITWDTHIRWLILHSIFLRNLLAFMIGITTRSR
jgi:hypothetical protein